jgi:hypothetical protein
VARILAVIAVASAQCLAIPSAITSLGLTGRGADRSDSRQGTDAGCAYSLCGTWFGGFGDSHRHTL